MSYGRASTANLLGRRRISGIGFTDPVYRAPGEATRTWPAQSSVSARPRSMGFQTDYVPNQPLRFAPTSRGPHILPFPRGGGSGMPDVPPPPGYSWSFDPLSGNWQLVPTGDGGGGYAAAPGLYMPPDAAHGYAPSPAISQPPAPVSPTPSPTLFVDPNAPSVGPTPAVNYIGLQPGYASGAMPGNNPLPNCQVVVDTQGNYQLVCGSAQTTPSQWLQEYTITSAMPNWAVLGIGIVALMMFRKR
jgi:hypothetical protein